MQNPSFFEHLSSQASLNRPERAKTYSGLSLDEPGHLGGKKISSNTDHHHQHDGGDVNAENGSDLLQQAETYTLNK